MVKKYELRIEWNEIKLNNVKSMNLGKMREKLKIKDKEFKCFVKSMKPNVLKTGSDRLVRPIEPSTCHKTGPVQSKNRFCIEPTLNRPNRRSDR